MTGRRRLLAALGACAAGAALPRASASGLASAPTRDAAARSVLRSGHSGEPDSLDPHLAVAAPALVVINDLFESLMTLDAGGRATLGAAARYAISDDGLEYRFTLRPGLLWSDGRPIEAADFVWSARRLADPRTALTGLANFIDLIANGRKVLRGELPPAQLRVDAPDPRTVRFVLAAPVPYFLTIVSFPVFAPMPRHVIERAGRSWTRADSFVCNGPFVLDEWRPGQYVRTRRNPRFHAAASVRLDGVMYRPIQDLNAGLRLFQTGELDTLTNFPPEKLDWLRENMPKELHLSPSLGVNTYVLNHRSPKLRDPRVRQALSLAIDRDVLTSRIVRSGDLPAWGFVPPGVPDHGPPLAAPGASARERLERARALMTAAGHGADRPLELELLYHTSEEHKKVAVAVAAMWQPLGVRVGLRNAERQVVEVATRAGDFEVARAAWFSSYPDPMGFLSFLRRDGPFNGGAYASRRFETAVDAATAVRDPAERGRLLRRAEEIAVEEQAAIPLYFLVSRRLVSRRVIGWRDDNLTTLRGARWLSLSS